MKHSAKLTARVKLTLTKRTVDALEPEDKPWIAWDDRLTGFRVRVHPSGAKAFLVNYRAGNGGRKAPNKRVVVGRAGRVTPDQARRRAQELLGRVAAGEDPAGERALPRLGEACEEYIKSGYRRAGGAKFWFHGLRNCFITVAERELMLPRSLTKRLVNHARPGDVTEGYAADWTVQQLREPAQRIADRIDELKGAYMPPAEAHPLTERG